ncbi:U6 snRNA phosphodiesterase 1 [Topomyia yanbarensis]|uniref:U6 snRNA phosphodiesterase 1 n=1 Tax=Topomyia yanbarensis TaxID=2498891 RepID=UPI00273AEF37|nr:U6 snRNA phosphodiesterase 1 [Topomyia yanbarensis]
MCIVHSFCEARVKFGWYSSSESEGEKDDSSKQCSAKLQSSKDLLRSIASTEPVAQQDSSKHQGRIRSFAHERGIWASYVFVDYNDVDPISDFQQLIIEKISNDLKLKLERVDKLHLSLTKTFVLRHHNISAFVETIRCVLRENKRFPILLSDLAIYVNEENTRTFLAVKVHDNSVGSLNKLVDKLNDCMRLYKLPEFYKDRSFHVSILWALGNKRQLLQENLPDLQQMFATFYEEEYCDMNLCVNQINFKCGNKYHTFDLLFPDIADVTEDVDFCMICNKLMPAKLTRKNSIECEICDRPFHLKCVGMTNRTTFTCINSE